MQPKMTPLDKLLKSGFKLVMWVGRYDSSIWAAVGREYSDDFDEVCQLTDSDDIEAVTFTAFAHNEGSWLPIVATESAAESLLALAKKLESLPPGQIDKSTLWTEAVDKAYTVLARAAKGHYGIATAIDQGAIPGLPNFLAE